MKLKEGVIVLCFFALSGCSTMVYGTKDVLEIKSNPPGANVSVSNGMTCQTPRSLTLPKSEGVTVAVSKDGCDTQNVTVLPVYSTQHHVAGHLGNVVTTLGLGTLVDYGTGANYRLSSPTLW